MSKFKQYRTKQRAAADLARMYAAETDGQQPDSWRQQSPDYQQQFLGSVEIMAGLEALANDPDIEAAAQQSLGKVSALEKTRERWPQWAVAATVILATTLGINAWLATNQQSASDIEVLRYITRVGEQKTVNLADGSVINLNTGTQLLVELGEQRRRVTLQRGEAFFDVAKDPTRPFTVDLGMQSITVLGTAFNLRTAPDSFTLAVVEGMVAIHPSADQVQGNEPILSVSKGNIETISAKSIHRITAGTVAEFNAVQQKIIARYDMAISRYQQWRSGQLRFEYEPLYKVVKELNRYSGKKILIEDDAIMNMKIFALIQLDQLDHTLLGLETTMPIKVTKYFDRIVIVGEDRQ